MMYRLDISAVVNNGRPSGGGEATRLLEIAILGLLNESPMHGYELRKRLSTLLGGLRAFSYGSLYPSLRRLQEAGWIDEQAPLDPPPADAGFGSRSRRAKKVYRLTAEGKEHFAALLAKVGPEAYDDEGFGTRLAFFAQTRSDIRLQILEGRKQRMTEQADGMRSTLARTRERLDRYTLQLQEHGLESVDREVRWLNELIETERGTAGRGPAGSDPGRTD
jgi:DNA-binding PadR family transcriptional regulator